MSSSNDPLFRLECVLLFALDVVKGPYIHSCAPANPPEVIRSFLQPPAGASTTGVAASTTSASHGIAPHTTASLQRRPDAYARDGCCGTSPSTTYRQANASATATNTVDGFAPSSLPHGGSLCGGLRPFLSTSPLLGARGAAAYAPQCGTMTPPLAMATNATSAGPSSPTNSVTRVGGSIISTAAAATGAPTTVRMISSSLLAQRHLLGLADASTTATPLDDARSFAMGTSAPTNNASVSEDSNTIFAISPQTNLSESQQTLPSVMPMVGSFTGVTNVSMSSNTAAAGGASASAAAVAAAVASLRSNTGTTPGAHDGGSRVAWMADGAGAVDDENNVDGISNSNAPPQPLPRASTLSAPRGGAAGINGSGSRQATTTTSAFLSSSSLSSLTTPLHTPPITASFADPGVVVEPFAAASRHASEGANAEPLPPPPHHRHPPYGIAGGTGSGGGSSRGVYAAPAAMSVSPAGVAAENGRINSYSDVFVPRSEFCRRVLWLYPAESGLLFLYYAEDIPGEHYQRKTLRYSLCLVFCVDKKRMTIGAGLLHQLVRPYSVVLTNIAEELREAEVKYAYMSRGLLLLQAAPSPRRPPAPRQPESSLFSPALAATAPAVMTSAAAVAAAVGSPRGALNRAMGAEEAEDEEDEGETVGGTLTKETGTATTGMTTTVAVSGGAQKNFRFGRRRLVNESTARPDIYHLALVERGVSATSVVSVARYCTNTNQNEASVAESAERDTPISLMSPQPPTTSGTEADPADATANDKSRAYRFDSARKTDTDVPSADAIPAHAKIVANTHATETAPITASSIGTSGSPSYIATSRTTAGTTPSSRFGTAFSPPPHEAGHAASPATAATTAAAANAAHSSSGGSGDNAETSSASAVSPACTNVDTLTATPPSSLPLRSRAASQGGGGAFPIATSSSPSAAFGDSTSTATTALSPMTSVMALSGAGGVSGPFPSAAGFPFSKHRVHTSPSAAGGVASTLNGSFNSQYRSNDGSGGGRGVHNANPLNAFITPTTAPQWTPLSELVEELYRCLRCSSEGDGEDDADGSVHTGSATTATPGRGLCGSRSVSPASRPAYGAGGGRGGNALMGRQGVATRPTFSSPPRRVRHAGTRQPYSPLTAMLPGSGRGGSWEGVRGGGGGPLAKATPSSAFLFTTGVTSPASFSSPASQPLPPQQQQRGDVSVVHLSDRLSFHVRRMAPLQAARLLHFDHVPVPIVPYDPTMMEWMDMAVHHVFRLVDGVRTVADLVFDVAMGTTTSLAEVYAEALRRSSAIAAAEAANGKGSEVAGERTASGPAARNAAHSKSDGISDRVSSNRGGSNTGNGSVTMKLTGAPQGNRAAGTSPGDGQNAAKRANNPNNTKAPLKDSLPPRGTSVASPARARVVAVPIDARPSLTLLPGVRYSVPTSAAAAAAAAAISDGQASPPSYVNVRVALSTPEPADASATVSAGAGGASSKNSPSSAAFAAANNTTAAATTPPPPLISVELPVTWVATTGIVVEALLHLELCHLIKIYRPWAASTLYSATQTLQRVLRNVHHPARQILAHRLLHVAWIERQQRRLKRQACHRRAAVQYRAHCEQSEQQQLSKETGGAAPRSLQRASQPLTVENTTGEKAATTVSLNNPSSTQELKSAHSPAKTPLPSPYLPVSTGDSARASPGAIAKSDGGREGGGATHQSPPDHPTWLLAAVAVSQSSSAAPRSGFHNDPHAPLAQPQQPAEPYHATPCVLSGASSVPRPPPPSGSTACGSGSGVGFGVGSSPGTHASSVSTSYVLSCSLKHTVCVGAAGRLQMNLTSSLPTSPVLHPAVRSADRGGEPVPRRMGSHHTQPTPVDGLPPPADSSYLQHAHSQPLHHQRDYVGLLSEHNSVEDDESNASFASSSTDSSSSSSRTSSSSYDARLARASVTGKTGRHTAAASLSSSSSSTSTTSNRTASQHASSPVSFQKKSLMLRGQHHRDDRPGSPSASRTSSATSVTSSSSPAVTTDIAHSDQLPHSLPTLLSTATRTPPSNAVHATDALVDVEKPSTSLSPRRHALAGHTALGNVRNSNAAHSGVANASRMEGAPQAEAMTVESAAATACPPHANVANLENNSSEEKRGSKPLKLKSALRVFIPSEAELSQTAAAALCALAKFSNTSVESVQTEMRRMPVWAPTLNHWSDRCVRAMVEVAMLNNWLEDVPQ
ncbi:hypothetical protein ABB37_00096 [Leptomonas pyrrhocoris]|uniref:Uncharacterized protein n=1 Tax=Leptomonas pyrrhocoris TaxID=157538 RepID=A0A0N0DZV4_LEPPY|nr:hypothetical protein ABB37_00096 [Leptomonas pyrrhocoris]KPA85728.1 hypothetical protein ABB37_00096 [Leptomonas pyrrhocoris]|eukprot:XP_015664167.1 hypothetical protein ABB37_00096 [Leptomonas pyrrhocoris]